MPRGLRVNIFPAGRSCSTTLLEKWEKEALESSIRFMNILLEEEKKLYTVSSTSLKELTYKVLKFKSDTEFTKRETSLQISVDRYYQILKERKHKQYIRDLTEFKEKRAFNFSGRVEKKNSRPSDISSSDIESSDSELRGQSYTNYRQNWPRGPRSWRGRNTRGRAPRGYQNMQPSADFSHASSSSQMGPSQMPPIGPSFLEKGMPYSLRENRWTQSYRY